MNKWKQLCETKQTLIQFCFLSKGPILIPLIWVTGFFAFKITENRIKSDYSLAEIGLSNLPRFLCSSPKDILSLLQFVNIKPMQKLTLNM